MLGTIECLYSTNYNIKHFQCLSSDLPLLQDTPQMKLAFGTFAAGSDCIILDTSEVYMYHAATDTWTML